MHRGCARRAAPSAASISGHAERSTRTSCSARVGACVAATVRELAFSPRATVCSAACRAGVVRAQMRMRICGRRTETTYLSLECTVCACAVVA